MVLNLFFLWMELVKWMKAFIKDNGVAFELLTNSLFSGWNILVECIGATWMFFANSFLVKWSMFVDKSFHQAYRAAGTA